MKIGVIGMGYVGLATAAVLAELGHHVFGIDNDASKIGKLLRGEVPIYEPGLEERIAKYSGEGRLQFSSRPNRGLEGCSVMFIAVGTPSSEDGSPDLSALISAADEIARNMTGYTLIAVKSTVPPGTCDWLEKRLLQNGTDPQWFDIASNPEFLREGTALSDMLYPDRMIIGTRSERAESLLRRVYEKIEAPFIFMSRSAAETTKYASNAFLAAKISFVNELARVCDAFGVDVTEVTAGMGRDARIGPLFLRAGLGYGGSCFPKDLRALYRAAASRGVDMPILRSVREINDTQVDWCIAKLKEAAGRQGQLDRRQITVWGAAFKGDTDDTRESRAILLMRKLSGAGCRIRAYDPLVNPELPGVAWFRDRYDSLDQSDVLIIATDWGAYADTDWHAAASRMKGNLLFDGRNLVNRTEAEAAGFRYIGVGRPDEGGPP